MAKTRKRKKVEHTEPVEVEKPKPEMPDKILKHFLEEKCGLSKLKNISMIRAGFLWQKGDIERYRINVWQTTYQMGEFCPDTKIIHSYFVFYYPNKQMVVDKTIEPVKKGRDLLGI
mgnify:CR=1 FL=1